MASSVKWRSSLSYFERSNFSTLAVFKFIAMRKPRFGGMWVMRHARPLFTMTLPSFKVSQSALGWAK